MNVWRALRRVLFPVAPPLPEPYSEQVLRYAAERTREDVQRAERAAAEQEERLRQLEMRLRLYERSLPASGGDDDP